jgi:predicted dehydrogenase
MNNKPTKNLTFLVIGGGSIGKRHLKNLHALGYHQLYCLKRKFDSLFEEQEQVKVITSLKDLNTSIDAVLVCNPTSLHNEGIAIAKELKAAIFMEKPLIHSLEALTEANSIMKTHDKPFFIGFMLRYHPLVKKINEILNSNILGSIYSARFSFGSYLPYWHPWENHKDSYASVKVLGGGVINTITHELDLIQYFFGTPQSVISEKANFNKLNIEVDEIAEAIFRYEDKLVTLHLDYLQKDYDRNILILGDNGSLSWNWHEQKITLKIHKQKHIEHICETFEVNNLYLDELQDFITLLNLQHQTHSLDFTHAVLNTKLLLAIHQSADEGIKIQL